ncbi:nickel-binding protein [Planctomycetota bacterium]
MAVQAKHGVEFVNYWYSEAERAILCLCDASNKEAAAAVHQEAHGGVADEIIVVKQGA